MYSVTKLFMAILTLATIFCSSGVFAQGLTCASYTTGGISGSAAQNTNDLSCGLNSITNSGASGTVGASAFGSNSNAIGDSTTAFGASTSATAQGATAIGSNALASDTNSVALGANSTTAAPVGTASGTINGTTYNYAGATPTSTVSVGSVGSERTITNVGAGRINTTSTDAINGSQLNATNQAVTMVATNLGNLGNSVANSFGGGAAYSNGAWTNPTYVVHGGTYNNVGAALTAVDSNLTNIYSELVQVAGGGASNAVVYDNASKTGVTLGGAGTTAPAAVHNVAAGTAPADAVNVGQLTSATSQAVQAANGYTDIAATNAVTQANNYTNQAISGLSDQFDQLNQRVNHLSQTQSRDCAMAQAGIGAALASAGASGPRVVAGEGLCSGGSSAVSIGVAAPIGDRWHVGFSTAWSAGMGGVNVGVGLDL
jgi:autotransporter adhesin